MKSLSTLTLVLFALTATACSSHRFVAHRSFESLAPRDSSQVRVSATFESDSLTEAGILEVVASSYADAHPHFVRLGADHGCHVVRPFATRTNVFGGRTFTSSETIFLASCLVPRRL